MEYRKNDLRFSLVILALVISLAFFSLKLILIQVVRSDQLTGQAAKQHNMFIELPPLRGTIYDRNLRPMAFNVPVYSLFANPKIMTAADKQAALEKLPAVLGVTPEYVAERLGRDKYFIWIKRKLPLETMEYIRALDITGLQFQRESERFYPNGSLAAHVIGFADTDNKGLEGIELFYNAYLSGKPGRMQVLRDAHQTALQVEQDFLPPQDGFDIVLTIDETIQYIAERALENAYNKHNAKAGSVIVLDVRTGEVLALANQPTYDLDKAAQSDVESRTNRAVSYVYEPGSVFKIVTAAAALESGMVSEDDKFFCENGKYRIANHILTDHHGHGTLTFQQVIEQSSNIGTVKVAQKIGGPQIYKYGKLFRFGIPTGIDLKGEVSGWLKDQSQWSKTTIGAIPIGYEVTVTPLQLVASVAAVANEGVFMRPFVVKYIQDQKDQIIKQNGPVAVDRAISPDTARRLTAILKGVVESGTGTRAQIKDIQVAGKTGTARKVMDGKYVQGKYYASFVGFAPADNPRLAIVVVMDQPHPSYFGGTVSAPVFQEVMSNSLRYLKVSE